MNPYIYKQSQYKASQSLPQSSWEKCKKEFDLYLENYIPSRLKKMYVKYLVHIWFRWVGFKQHLKDFTPEKRDEFLRHQDKRWFFSHSLLTLSYSVVLRRDPRPLNMLERATLLIKSSLDFYVDLEEGRLKQDTIGNQPAEMGQYFNIFGCNLVPKISDIMHRVHKCKHIAVCIDEVFYKLAITSQTSIEDIYSSLEALLADAETAGPNRLGWLSAAPRKQCKEIYSKYAAEMSDLENAFFVVCLDTKEDRTEKEFFQTIQVSNCGNRWFHSSLQLVVNKSSSAGVHFSNRNYIDGNVGSRFSNELYQRSVKIMAPQSKSGGCVLPFKRIEPVMENENLATLKESLTPYVNNEDFHFNVHLSADPGSKKDSLFIASLLLASERLYGHPLKVIQMCNMSKYKHLGLTHAFATTREFIKFSSYIQAKTYDKRTARYLLNEYFTAKEAAQKFARGSTWLAHNVASLIEKKWASFNLLLFFIRVKKIKAEVLSSHPQEYFSIEHFGRPGIILPNTSFFGLHYVFKPGYIDLVYMPSQEHASSVALLSKEIQKAWDEIIDIYAIEKGNAIVLDM